MKFGIFYEHQLPCPWKDHSEYSLLQESLEQIELADGLGYDYAWEVEHHFLEEYSHSSAPEVFLGAASQHTSVCSSISRSIYSSGTARINVGSKPGANEQDRLGTIRYKC